MTKKIDRLVDKCGTAFSSWQSRIIFDQRKHGKPTESRNREIVDKVRDRQEELASEVGNGPQQLGAYLRRVLKLGVGDEIDALPFPRDCLTPSEFVKPPVELEEELGKSWQKLPPRLASRPVFWLLCHVAWIEQGRLGDSGHLVRAALMDDPRAKDSEARTRNLLRRTGGIFVRGNVSVFSNCPMARAWWRWYLARQVAEVTKGRVGRADAHATLHASNGAWEELARLSLWRITVVNQRRARAAVVSRLHALLGQHGKLNKNHVKDIAVEFARVGLRRSFEHTSWDELMGLSPNDRRPWRGPT